MPRPRRIVATIVGAAALALVVSCSSDAALPTRSSKPTTTELPSTTDTTTTTSAAQDLLEVVCTGAPTITDAGTVTSDQLTEISGLAASRRNPDQWWVHNDSGDSARIFALDQNGAVLATVGLSGASAQDWEDIAVGPGDGDGDKDGRGDGDAEGGTIYVGDIGDNTGIRDSVQIYRLPEPEVDPDADGSKLTAAAETLTLTYPDGAHDAEALLVDPVDGDLLIITKDWTMAGSSSVYRVRADVPAGSTTELEKVAALNLPVLTLVTGADVSSDGSVVAVRSYGGVDLFPRIAGEPLTSAFEQTPCAGPLPVERQGEAIAFASDGASYTTVSEGEDPVLHQTGP